MRRKLHRFLHARKQRKAKATALRHLHFLCCGQASGRGWGGSDEGKDGGGGGGEVGAHERFIFGGR